MRVNKKKPNQFFLTIKKNNSGGKKMIIIPDLTKKEITHLLKVKSDYIFSYKQNGNVPKTFAISRKEIKRISKLYKNKLRTIGDIITFYLNLDTPITVLKVYKHPHNFYQRRDFTVEIVDSRTYRPSFDEPFTLQNVRITNLCNGTTFEDFVRPDQLNDITSLIEWDINGEVINL